MYKKLYFNLARNSLRHIIRTYKIREINLPYYLCDEIRHSVIKEKCNPVFYHIDDKFFPVKKFDKDEYILYPDYFGICGKNTEKLCDMYQNIIIDNSHSFYSEPKGFACFNSARKFLPVYNGSVLWIKNINNINQYKIEEYKNILTNEQEKIQAETEFQKTEPAFICEKLKNQIENINDLKKRKDKFLFLHKKYKSINLLKINTNDIHSPFCYPLLLNDDITADKYADELINQGYEILRYWNNLPKTYSEYKFFRNLIPIPISK